MSMNRRDFSARLAALLAAPAAGVRAVTSRAGCDAASLHLSTFRVDATPPLGHPLCGGWIKPAAAIDDPLECLGVVLQGAGNPIVLAALDWTGLLNETHDRFAAALAEGAGTTPDRVAIQCVHQHDAPFACHGADRWLRELAPGVPTTIDPVFVDRLIDGARTAVRSSLTNSRSVRAIATAQAKVEQVAANRRILGPDGKVAEWRASSSRKKVHQDAPEGLVDPFMKGVSFVGDRGPLATLYYYATHPMSFYGQGRVGSDFVGLARKRRQQSSPETRLYFTGCAGNVAAGKYNDGSPEARIRLTGRIHDAMAAVDAALQAGSSLHDVGAVEWRTAPVRLQPRAEFDEATVRTLIADPRQTAAVRIRMAMMLDWLKRCEAGRPIVLGALHVGPATLLHLPAETFVEYQLFAQRSAPGRFVATAAYGDGGPWYIPTADAYPQGGYEVAVAFTEPTSQALLVQGAGPLVTM